MSSAHSTPSEPLVSVVIPAYNALQFIRAAIDSVLTQTYDNLEVIVVDDGSTDGTTDLARQFTDPRVRCIDQQNAGASAARNRGIRAATGRYVAFLDADDLWQPTKLAQQVARAEHAAAPTLVDSWAYFVDARGRSLPSPAGNQWEGDVWELMLLLRLVFYGSSTLMVPRACFDTVGLFREDLRYAEDWEMWLRLTREYPLAVVTQPLAAYRQHPGGKHHHLDGLLEAMLSIVDLAVAERADGHHLRRLARGSVYLHVASRLCTQVGGGIAAMVLLAHAVANQPRLAITRRAVRVLALGIRDMGQRRLSAIRHTLGACGVNESPAEFRRHI